MFLLSIKSGLFRWGRRVVNCGLVFSFYVLCLRSYACKRACCLCMCMHICACVHVRMCVYACMHVRVRVHAPVHVHVNGVCVHGHRMDMCMCMYLCACTCANSGRPCPCGVLCRVVRECRPMSSTALCGWGGGRLACERGWQTLGGGYFWRLFALWRDVGVLRGAWCDCRWRAEGQKELVNLSGVREGGGRVREKAVCVWERCSFLGAHIAACRVHT